MTNIKEKLDEKIASLDNFLQYINLNNRIFIDRESNKDRIFISEFNQKESDDILAMLYSSFILMLYNIVESTIRDGFLKIYIEINDKKTFSKLTKELQNIWLSQQINGFITFDIVCKSLHQVLNNKNNSAIFGKKEYEAHIKNFINERILDKVKYKKINFQNKLSLSGNVDHDLIINKCLEHGIQPKGKLRDSHLTTIKTKRNHLSHGNNSFIEIGKDLSLSVLKDIKKDVITYLENFNYLIEKHLNQMSLKVKN
ncbi:MAG TPA: MAE_28990/MAE_18760 family HEPN-like nuclease [Aquella sp.]|nr:MAE_28990/MAE_18760 family HEPN-like nuclease [Aquella sp.]